MLNNAKIDNCDIEQVLADIMPVIARLPPGMTVKTVDLFEPVIWQGISMSDHIRLGKIVVDLSRSKQLPLTIIERTSANHCQFIIDHH